MRYEAVRLEPGRVARVVLDRPPLNVLTTVMLGELAAAVREAGSDPATRVLLLTGEGRAFCAGVDVADHTADRVAGMIDAFSGAIRALLDVELPVIGAVNGAALGGGLELALACDIVLARSGAKLGQPEIQLGVFPPAAAALLPRRVGMQRALDMILTGCAVRAEEAVAMGLVTRAVPADDFDVEVEDYVERMASASRPVLRLAKRATRSALDRPVTDALQAADRLYLDELMALHDPHEGLAAFMEKRAPVWSDA